MGSFRAKLDVSVLKEMRTQDHQRNVLWHLIKCVDRLLFPCSMHLTVTQEL